MEVTKHLLIGMILQVWGGYFLKLGGGKPPKNGRDDQILVYEHDFLLHFELSQGESRNHPC